MFKYTKDGETEKALAGAGFTLYDEGVEVKLTKVEGSNIYKVDPNGTVTQIMTDATGKFEIEGLEKGTYVLKETLTPAGYNTCDDITVVIGENGVLTQDTSVNVDQVKVLNQAGTVLPETGGMGTTILYIVGGVLVLAAVVLLVTKRRMKDSE